MSVTLERWRVVEDRLYRYLILVACRGRPDDRSVRVTSPPPTAKGLGPMMMAAERDQVRIAGRPMRIRHTMIQIATLGRLPAPRKAAHLVAGHHMPGK